MFIPFLCLLLSVVIALCNCEPIEMMPKMVRWPTHVDHYLCRRLHSGLGIRSHAVTNLSGDLCRTYCRIIDRMGGKITYTENISPNFVRCGPYQARCVDGNCVGNNFPNSAPSGMIPPSNTDDTSIPESSEPPNELAEVSNTQTQIPIIPETVTTLSIEENSKPIKPLISSRLIPKPPGESRSYHQPLSSEQFSIVYSNEIQQQD